MGTRDEKRTRVRLRVRIIRLCQVRTLMYTIYNTYVYLCVSGVYDPYIRLHLLDNQLLSIYQSINDHARLSIECTARATCIASQHWRLGGFERRGEKATCRPCGWACTHSTSDRLRERGDRWIFSNYLSTCPR